MSLEEALGLTPATVNTTQSETKLKQLQTESNRVKTDVDRTVTESNRRLNAVRQKTAAIKITTNTAIDNTKEKMNEVTFTMRRLITQVPVLSRITEMQEKIKSAQNFGLLSMGGAVNLLFLALSIYQTVSMILEEQKMQREQYQQLIMQTQGFATKSQFEKWETEQRKALDAYSSGIIP
jgi:hypothetical protein